MPKKKFRIIPLIFLVILFISPLEAAKRDRSVDEGAVTKFYDDLMALISYDKYKDFYDSYMDKNAISYESFVREIKEKGIRLSGGYDSKLIGWERKGRKVVVFLETMVLGERKRISLNLVEDKEGLKISPKEFFEKVCGNKKGKRRGKR